ncbi:MAG: maleylpyruvate isomerase family mycothiol-dependent enzyme [Mycobacterium sp.]
MTTQTEQHPTKRRPRLPQLDPDTAVRLAATEYERVALMLEQLRPEDWGAPTDCTDWDVRAMAGHMLGMVQMIASIPEMIRQQFAAKRTAKRTGMVMIDALTALQVEKNATLTTDELIGQVRRLGPKAVKARRRAPDLMRKQTMQDQDEWRTMGYLIDVILTRDPFLHRVDIARATGTPMTASAEHEGIIIDDVVAEWAGRHSATYDLELTGPAGGHWKHGNGEHITMDALEFCRALSGRAPAEGLLRTQVPF